MNVWRLTKQGSAYWDLLSMSNQEYRWDESAEDEISCLKPYGEIVRESIKKCDISLKIKL